jgi:hypothetical protein
MSTEDLQNQESLNFAAYNTNMFELIEALHRTGETRTWCINVYLGSATQNMNLERVESCSMLPQETSFT